MAPEDLHWSQRATQKVGSPTICHQLHGCRYGHAAEIVTALLGFQKPWQRSFPGIFKPVVTEAINAPDCRS